MDPLSGAKTAVAADIEMIATEGWVASVHIVVLGGCYVLDYSTFCFDYSSFCCKVSRQDSGP